MLAQRSSSEAGRDWQKLLHVLLCGFTTSVLPPSHFFSSHHAAASPRSGTDSHFPFKFFWTSAVGILRPLFLPFIYPLFLLRFCIFNTFLLLGQIPVNPLIAASNCLTTFFLREIETLLPSPNFAAALQTSRFRVSRLMHVTVNTHRHSLKSQQGITVSTW